MPLSDEHLYALACRHFTTKNNLTMYQVVSHGRAIESAATAPLLAQIAALEAKDSVSTAVLQMKKIAQLEAQLLEARVQMERQKDEWLSWEAKRSDLEKDAERYRFILPRIVGYDWSGPYVLFSWPKAVSFNFSNPSGSIDAAIAQESGQ